jgi:hypothetical protein
VDVTPEQDAHEFSARDWALSSRISEQEYPVLKISQKLFLEEFSQKLFWNLLQNINFFQLQLLIRNCRNYSEAGSGAGVSCGLDDLRKSTTSVLLKHSADSFF